MQCPICLRRFPMSAIEAHANECLEASMELDAGAGGGSGSQPMASPGMGDGNAPIDIDELDEFPDDVRVTRSMNRKQKDEEVASPASKKGIPDASAAQQQKGGGGKDSAKKTDNKKAGLEAEERKVKKQKTDSNSSSSAHLNNADMDVSAPEPTISSSSSMGASSGSLATGASELGSIPNPELPFMDASLGSSSLELLAAQDDPSMTGGTFRVKARTCGRCGLRQDRDSCFALQSCVHNLCETCVLALLKEDKPICCPKCPQVNGAPALVTDVLPIVVNHLKEVKAHGCAVARAIAPTLGNSWKNTKSSSSSSSAAGKKRGKEAEKSEAVDGVQDRVSRLVSALGIVATTADDRNGWDQQPTESASATSDNTKAAQPNPSPKPKTTAASASLPSADSEGLGGIFGAIPGMFYGYPLPGGGKRMPKGIGYGGSPNEGGGSRGPTVKSKKTAAQISKACAAQEGALSRLCDFLKTPAGEMSFSCSLTEFAVLAASCLANVVAGLLRNWSPIECSAEIYPTLSGLLHDMAFNPSLVFLLLPDPSDEDSPDIPKALSNVEAQATQFLKHTSIIERADHQDEDMDGTVPLMLQMQSVGQDVGQKMVSALELFKSLRKETNQNPISSSSCSSSATSGVAGSLQDKAGEGTPAKTPSKKRKSDQSAEAAPPHPLSSSSSAFAAPAQISPGPNPRLEYVEKLRPLQFAYTSFERPDGTIDHYYAQHKGAAAAALTGVAGGGAGKIRLTHMAHVMKEFSALSANLPLQYESSIFVRVDEAKMHLAKALILAPEDTPYANGAFVFDIMLPPDYPNHPPLVHLVTTAHYSRFNPNLYNEGKVCLSLLGTWSGPGWKPFKSTLLQVLVSIQSLIFIAEPYFNEPGWESQYGTPMGKQASEKYNEGIVQYTSRLAILQHLTNPDSTFAAVTSTHFRLKAKAVREQCEKWLKANNPQAKTDMPPAQMLDAIRVQLQILEASGGSV